MVSGRTIDRRTDVSRARSVRVTAPGKINVSLKVGPPREDGYHGIASVFLAVSLYEEVTATETAGGISVTVNGQGTLNLPAASIPLDSSNLAVRAAELLAEVSPGHSGVHLDITKRVPIAGGMGGGSADAAAALLACDALWGSGFSRDELAKIAVDLGADVPFALVGGTAVGLGVGDLLTPAISKTPLHLVLVTSDYGLSTPEVYRTLDALRLRNGVEPDAQPEIDPAILGAMRAGDALALAPLLHNDLQEAALELAPALGDILETGRAAGALAGIVSGSGPTVAFLAQNPAHAAELETLLTHEGLQATSVQGPAHGARITADHAG
ncbi:4-(cytidine 5'-diphospho)-2-C-methyl-D-erythritol kinase [Arthrobacter agilis]|uniref:4-(cytidine 5'-diphospho)-2-C-methyl-D-erythritol kinase n=1 Tax=Arthrobacter agilis TaxID=37921 RepID=UPI000B34CFED|nr:4-(cytidine 5'-diphospho)-2-C-methyl-D-erythritol kinase [Arthrobacter agilis]OUM40504.1 4-(cytidine 5'-diphospho)-2-C-methyl-D-erythritol kinase [Arthrobacter agilis]PPB45116.1 4-(cytidine 5'-diphospho)-2-C-methyl-D-erythritol kinase [Arthrobacter agilis]TPV27819.1 4-(cytidine 5'-diphospho)-2-C-methyl-D-erythritol kinase [Arthrobacter agilis]VDR31526.1 4-diphosphocytidyl-2-C-methyl-D-erythritol kinase [Arthrobacter agilis]